MQTLKLIISSLGVKEEVMIFVIYKLYVVIVIVEKLIRMNWAYIRWTKTSSENRKKIFKFSMKKMFKYSLKKNNNSKKIHKEKYSKRDQYSKNPIN